jgi:glycerophosphoryl diester phosphodiesterase
LYLMFLHPHERAPEHLFFDKPGPWAIAHRGGRGLWPENTLFAFEQAAALGVDVLEMDLRVTLDGAIVAMHDARVDRTTGGSGRVSSMTLAALRALDAGFHFRNAAGEFPFRGRGIVAPTLEEVLARFPQHRLNVEMKEFTPAQAEQLCAMLTSAGALNRVMVASMSHSSMRAFRDRCPSVASSVTVPEGFALYLLYRLGIPSLYRGPAVAIQAPRTMRGRPLVEPDLVELAGRYNLPMQVWTVNDPAEMKRLLAMGVHGILTDYPDRLLALLGRLPPGR